MTSNIDVCDLRLDLWHVTADALAALAVCRVMRVLLQGHGMRSVVGTCTVTGETELVENHRLPEIRIIARPVNIVAVVTGDPARIHQALNKIISLHPVLVSRAVAVMCKRGRSQRVLLKLPVVT